MKLGSFGAPYLADLGLVRLRKMGSFGIFSKSGRVPPAGGLALGSFGILVREGRELAPAGGVGLVSDFKER
ncbi:MAG TPA: hypothetical protein VGS58_09030 [Candidatus Sulfopaludibacter sp.]|nr:hypothetical protein [Candidatus Sulfopaludibacter sp.]